MNLLDTERLQLRRLTLAEAKFIHELVNEPAFLRNIGDKGVRSLDDACTYIREGPIASYKRYGFGMYAVFLKESGTCVGICGLVKRDTLDDVDIGFAFLERYRSHGYAYESALAVLEYARDLLRLERIAGVTVPDNTASIRLLEKLGLRFERNIRLSDDGPALCLYMRTLAPQAETGA